MQTPSQIRLGAQAFADATGISIQAARRALRGCARGRPWRGIQLLVRPQLSSGGLGGRVWEVALGLETLARFNAPDRLLWYYTSVIAALGAHEAPAPLSDRL